MNKKVSIIIVTWNGMKWIDACLSSIRNSSYPVSTIVIDNYSTDETPNHIASNFPEVELIRSDKNWGFGKANNIGMQKALEEGADYCFLLNQDAYIKENTISELLNVAENGNYGVISPMHLNGDASRADVFFRNKVMGACEEYLDNVAVGGKETIFCNYNIPAAAWLLPRKTIEEVGLFDSLFYHYGEDDNYLQRLYYHKRKVIFTTKAIVMHDRMDSVGNKKAYMNKRHFRAMLVSMANINTNAAGLFVELCRFLYSDIGGFVIHLLTGKWSLIYNFPASYLTLIMNASKISKSRKRNKQKLL